MEDLFCSTPSASSPALAITLYQVLFRPKVTRAPSIFPVLLRPGTLPFPKPNPGRNPTQILALLYLSPLQEKAAVDLATAESQRAALEAERKSLRLEAEQAKTLGQTLAREKSLVETSRKVRL